MIVIDVLGTPAPKGSSRAFVNKKTGRAIVAPSGSAANKAKIKSWEASVRAQAIAVLGGYCTAPAFVALPLRVEITFRMTRPFGHWSKKPGGGLMPSAPIAPATKPDIDKLVRATLDSLTGLVFDDDSRIVQLSCAKQYAQPGAEGARITIEEWKRDRSG